MLPGYRAVWLCLFILYPLQAQQPFDVLITGGKIVDGTGSAWYIADVGINGDVIAQIGNLTASSTRTRIDAKGMAVTPGFIDIHSHGSRGLFEVPSAENLIRQGVTTMVEGNDGGSPIPLAPFLERVAKTPIGVNFASFAGHGSIREKVMGTADRRATADELRQMVQLGVDAMRDGAFGLSTGLFYVPGNFASTAEVIAIAREMGRLGGIHISHMRDEGDEVVQSVLETIRIGEEGGLPTQITHHKIIGGKNWGKSKETLKAIEAARKRGVDVTIDQYPYTATSTGTAALFPQWSLAGGRAELARRLADPDKRAKIRTEIALRLLEGRGAGDLKNVVMASCAHDASLAGKHLGQITDERGRTPNFENAADTVIEIQLAGGCSAVYHAADERDVEAVLRSPLTMIASDGGIPVFGRDVPHPRSYGTFARVLGRYVRELRVIDLEEAIRKMTSYPASRLKLLDRGVLRPGMRADIAVFDPDKISDRATFSAPHQYAEGVVHVLVNGRPALLDGRMTGERSGRVLYGPGIKKTEN